MGSDISGKEGRKCFKWCTQHILFTVIWCLTLSVKDPSDSEKTYSHHYMGYLLLLAARNPLHAPFHKQDSTYHGCCYTSHGALAGMRNGLVDPPWRIDPMTHCTMSRHSIMEPHLAPPVMMMVMVMILMMMKYSFFRFIFVECTLNTLLRVT